jgi:transposase
MRPEHWLFTIPLRLRPLFRRAETDQEWDEELRDHLERRTEEFVAKGIAPQEARWRAQLDLGGVEQTKEECRDARKVNWIQDLVQDLRAMNEGYCWEEKAIQRTRKAAVIKALGPWASRRRQELLELLDRMNPTIEELTAAIERETRKRPETMRLMTHPGVGPITALAYALIIGTPTRFQRGRQIGTYVGMIPCEESSARKQRLGRISKQGNSLLRFLLVEAAQAAARVHPDWRPRYIHLSMRRHKSIAKVAMGRRLAVRLYWTWRNGCDYSPSLEFGSYAGQLGIGNGVK